MDRFPAEFADALRPDLPGLPAIRGDKDRLRWFPLALRPKVRLGALALLESHMEPYLKRMRKPVAAETITGMTRNYSEALPKAMRNRTVILDKPRSRAMRTAQEIGLSGFLKSESLRKFAEGVSGFPLAVDPGLQVICYRPGDYVGPHNDHHPEEAHLRGGYVDLQITLTNDAVLMQTLVYERAGDFNRVVQVGIESGVSVSMLPFWHQVTPMIAKRGQEAEARRWLLLVSFVIRGGGQRHAIRV